MNELRLPTDELKKYGIIENDNSFSNKLSPEDIQKFLDGYIMLVDNEKKRLTFQLTDGNSQLKVNVFERDQNLSNILDKSQQQIIYSDIVNLTTQSHDKVERKVFINDVESGLTKEYDLLKNASEITQIIKEDHPLEINAYKEELVKLKNFLYDKLDQYPEIAKKISNDLNIVNKEIDNVSQIPMQDLQVSNANKNNIDLNVNDYDMYEDANRHREQDEEIDEEITRSKLRGR